MTRVRWTQDADSVREQRLAGHVILVLRTARGAAMAPDTVCLAHFLAPLRASSIHARELKPVVIHADREFVESVWASIANFPKLFVYPVSGGSSGIKLVQSNTKSLLAVDANRGCRF